MTKEALKLAQEPSATRPCRSCGETGERWTGINEAPTSICKPCNGTGQIALAKPAQGVDYWIREATAARQAEMALRRELETQPAQEPVAHILQFIKELRPAIGPMAGMGKSKTTQEWFDIVINEIERLQSTKGKTG